MRMKSDQPLSPLSQEAAHELGVQLKRWKAARGWRQSDLGRVAQLSQSQISRILDGKAREVTQGVCRLAKAADIDLAFLEAAATDPVRDRLHAELDRAWDGSHAQAEALVSLLRAARALVQTPQGA